MAARQFFRKISLTVQRNLQPHPGIQKRISAYLIDVIRDYKIKKEEEQIWGKSIAELWNCKIKDDGDPRWYAWVTSSHKLWIQKNEEQRREDLQVRWLLLRDYLHGVGFEIHNHRPLLAIKSFGDDDRTIKCTIGSPNTGLESIQKFTLDRGPFDPYDLPRQAVNGLLCIYTSNMEEFLIYNPTTGERSPWIETTAKETQGENRRVVDCIELGFDPVSNHHKVICISGSILTSYATDEDGFPVSSDQQLGAEDQIVEVLSVGENTWRKIEAVPPYRVGNGREYLARPVYVNGNMYWRFRYTSKGEVLMGFDFGSEEFRVIPIPDFFIEEDPEDDFKPFQPVELMEIDGHIAVLDSMWSYENSLAVMHEDADGNIEWKHEDIRIPYSWNVKRDPSIVSLTGTNQIFIQPECPESIFYYNRKTKKYLMFPISPDRDLFTCERILQL